MKQVTNRSRRTLIVTLDPALPYSSSHEKLAGHGVWRRKFAADAELLSEPIHCLESLQRPDHLDLFRDSLPVPHPLNQIQKLRDDGCNTTPATNQDYCLKGCKLSLHPAIWPIKVGSIRLKWSFLGCRLEHFASKAT